MTVLYHFTGSASPRCTFEKDWHPATALVIGVLLRPRRSRLPPGPRGLPIVGTYSTHPRASNGWNIKSGGDIQQATSDLLDKRSAIYSDRPSYPMAVDLVGCGWNFALAKYDDSWRLRRRIFHQHFQPSDVVKYQPRVLKGAREVLHHLLETPDNFIARFRHFAGSVSMGIAYGLEVLPEGDPYISNIERAIYIEDVVAAYGAYLVDFIPILKYVPTWFPGAGFKRQAAQWRKYEDAVSELPLSAVKKAMADGVASPSILRSLLNDMDDDGDKAHLEKMFSSIGATAFAGEIYLQSVSSFGTFVLAMLLYPDVQRKAQEEIDRVVGYDRLPDFSDQPQVMRWRPVVPLVEDEYKGYRIPAGSLVLGNSWAILHDPETFPDPEAFKPEPRYLRIRKTPLPGRHMASAILWITVASVLADGAVVEPSGRYTSGLNISPEPFSCAFKPRSQAAEALIRAFQEA
ncbi:cytochrome P450 [Amylocystis lapponica]|nr:cytochrome P450 [Amylocystis lapponica]